MSGATDVLSSAGDDDAHRAWLRAALAEAAIEASATVVGEAVFGWRDRSLGARVRTESAELWLRVVTEQEQWVGGEFWTGNTDANTIIGIPKPRVLRNWEWAENTTRGTAVLPHPGAALAGRAIWWLVADVAGVAADAGRGAHQPYVPD
jgi:hypothetical protein